MYYSETKVIIGGLAHVPVLIFIANLIKGKFEALAARLVEVKVAEPKVKLFEVEEESVNAEGNTNEVKEEVE